LAALSFSVSGACTKILGNHISSVELVFFRNIIGVVFVGISLFRRPLNSLGGKPFLLIFRGVIGTLALFTFFYSITQIGLAEAITYQQSYPIFLAVMLPIVFKERVTGITLLAIIIGFSGILMLFVPQFKIQWAAVSSHAIGLSNAVMTGLAYVSIKQLSGYYDSRAIVLSFMVSGIVLPLISMVVGAFYTHPHLGVILASYVQPVGSDWFWIGVLAISALLGQIFLTRAFSLGNTSEVSAIGYSNILFSVFFGILLGDKLPTWLGFLGMFLIIVSGLLISFQKKL
jgi:drug/metabolite transporter (DMT)-like permease